MKTINFDLFTKNENMNAVIENNGKVAETFVTDLRNAFEKPFYQSEMRFKQSFNGRLVANLKITYPTGTEQKLAGGVDADLILAVIAAMQGNTKLMVEYKAAEHYVETPEEDENLVLDLFSQFLRSPMNRLITTDWISKEGDRYRRVFFYPTRSHGRCIKFCLPATEEVNSLIEKACLKKTPEEMMVEEELDKINVETCSDSETLDLN